LFNKKYAAGQGQKNLYIYLRKCAEQIIRFYHTQSANMDGKEIAQKKLPGKKKPPTLTLKIAPTVKPATKSRNGGIKKTEAKNNK